MIPLVYSINAALFSSLKHSIGTIICNMLCLKNVAGIIIYKGGIIG